jgi:hypothetical protein
MTVQIGTLLKANFNAMDADGKQVHCDYTVEVVDFITGSLGDIPVVRDVAEGNTFTITNLDASIKKGSYEVLGE